MSEQNINELSSNAKTFCESFHQVYKADFKYKNIFKNITIPAGIYSIPVIINKYELFYNWLTH